MSNGDTSIFSLPWDDEELSLKNGEKDSGLIDRNIDDRGRKWKPTDAEFGAPSSS